MNHLTPSPRGQKLLSLVLIIAMMMSLSGCGETAGGPSSTAASESTVAQPEKKKCFGKPWINSCINGNLPEELPEAKDDIYLHYNYNLAKRYQEYDMATLNQYSSKHRDFLIEFMGLGYVPQKPTRYTRAEMDALTIFYNQAKDLSSVKERGLEDLLPFFTKVDGARSISELNNVLLSKDFPFSPFIDMDMYAANRSKTNGVYVCPHFLFGEYGATSVCYQDSEYEYQGESENVDYYFQVESDYVSRYLSLAGCPEDETDSLTKELLEFEKSYGKYAESETGLAKITEFGKVYEKKQITGETYGKIKNFPLKNTIDKFGKSAGVLYTDNYKWIEELDKQWTDNNLDLIKLMIKASIISECSPYLNPDYISDIRMKYGFWPYDEEEFAASVCERSETFAHLMAKVYIECNYTDHAISRIKDLSKDIIKTYKEIVNETGWLSETSKKNIIHKLDSMKFNILVPEGGYRDFSGLKLIPAEDGGTLVGNYLRIKDYMNRTDNASLGKAADGSYLWDDYSPFSGNCYYSWTYNNINVFPGYLMLFDYTGLENDEKVYTLLGETIAHEISHGFDYNGMQYDEYGRKKVILDEGDADHYLEITDTLSDYYYDIEIMEGEYANGDQVIKEAAADLCAYQILFKMLKEKKNIDYDAVFENLSYLQFEVFSSAAFTNNKLADPHPFGYLTVNVNSQMQDETYEVFDIKEGDGMYLPEEKRIKIFGE